MYGQGSTVARAIAANPGQKAAILGYAKSHPIRPGGNSVTAIAKASGVKPTPGALASDRVIPQKVSGSFQVDPKITRAFGLKPPATKPLAPTTDKVTSPRAAVIPAATPPPVSYSGTTTPASLSLPGLPADATYQPVATPNLDPYGNKTPAEVVSTLLAPQYAALGSQSRANQSALTGFTQSVLAALKGLPQATAQDYTQAQNVTDALASKASDLLSGANPNSSDQAILQSINAPASQQQAIADQLRNTFSGGGAVLYDTAGANAGSALARDKAAALAYANAQPGIEGLAATQAERNLLYQDAQQKAAIAAQAPTLANQVAAAKANATYNEAQFTAGQNSAVSSNALARAGYRQNNAALGIKTTNAIASVNAKAAPKFNASSSRALGYQADQYGNPILNKNGSPLLLPGYALDNSGNVIKKSLGGASKQHGLTQGQTLRLRGTATTLAQQAFQGFTDSKGKVHPALSLDDAILEAQKEGLPNWIYLPELYRFYPRQVKIGPTGSLGLQAIG
jgi:hypothetical protein